MVLLLPNGPFVQMAKDKSPLPALVLVVVESILEVFFLCLTGFWLAHKGIVDDKAKKILNKLNVSLFTPALLFSKVAFSLTPEKLADLYIIPIGFVLITAFSACVAWLMGTIFKLKPGQRNFAIACTMFQNSNSLPIALMQSLIGEKMPLSWGPHDTRDQQLGRALSYLVLFSTLGIIVRWSIGVRLLTSAEAVGGDDEDGEGETNVVEDLEAGEGGPFADEHEAAPLLNDEGNGHGARARRGRQSTNTTTASTAVAGEGEQDDRISNIKSNGNGNLVKIIDGDATPSKKSKRSQDRVFQSFPNTPIPSQYGGSQAGTDAGTDDDEEDDDAEWGAEHGSGRRHLLKDGGAWRRRMRKAAKPFKRVGKAIGAFMTVPLWAAVLSLVVACIPPLQHALNEAEPLKSAIKNAGNCSVPITLVTLGTYFYRPSSSTTPHMLRGSSSPPHHSAAPTKWQQLNPLSSHRRRLRRANGSTKPGETRTVFVAVMSRMVIVPLCLLPLFGVYAALTVNVADDPVFVVVACLLISSPTAITLAQITSSAAGDTFEKLISRTLFVSYAIMTAPITILSVICALYIDKFQ